MKTCPIFKHPPLYRLPSRLGLGSFGVREVLLGPAPCQACQSPMPPYPCPQPLPALQTCLPSPLAHGKRSARCAGPALARSMVQPATPRPAAQPAAPRSAAQPLPQESWDHRLFPAIPPSVRRLLRALELLEQSVGAVGLGPALAAWEEVWAQWHALLDAEPQEPRLLSGGSAAFMAAASRVMVEVEIEACLVGDRCELRRAALVRMVLGCNHRWCCQAEAAMRAALLGGDVASGEGALLAQDASAGCQVQGGDGGSA